MKTQRRPPLDHISGMRALLSGWIVLGHYCSFPPQEGVFTLLLGRGYVVVLRGPLGLKGWALGRLRLKRLKTGLGPF